MTLSGRRRTKRPRQRDRRAVAIDFTGSVDKVRKLLDLVGEDFPKIRVRLVVPPTPGAAGQE